MKQKRTLLSFVTLLFLVGTFSSGVAMADRCSADTLNKLPPKKRAFIEKRCEKQKARKAFTISNACCVAKERAPLNVYQGGDRDMWERKVRSAWKKKYPGDKILGVNFPQAHWKRENTRHWDGATSSWYSNDISVLPVNVVLKKDNDNALIFFAYVNKDNQDNSIRIGVDTKKTGYVVKQMLLENYK